MKTQIKGIALLLAVILTLSGLLHSSAPIPASDVILSTLPTETTAPTTTLSTAPQPTTQPTTSPTTFPTEPPTEPTTQPPTEPSTTPTPPPTTLPEPWSSTNVTVGTEVPGITAKKAFVYDCESKTFLYMKSEADAKIYPASITKLMNAYTALQHLDPSAVLAMDADILSLVPYDTSRAALYAGDQLTVEMVLRAMLLPSGSDAAHLLAVSTGRVLASDPTLPAQQAENVFVEEMNRQADFLGLVNTNFVNCDGYSDYYHYTCMSDLTIIAAVCLDTPLIRDTVSRKSAVITYADGRTKTLNSTNSLLNPNSSYYRSEARGMKTGTTNASGSCLLSAFWVDDHYMLVGVFQCTGNSQRYNNALKLFDTYRNYQPPIAEPQPTVPPTTAAPTMRPTTQITTQPTTQSTTQVTTVPTTVPPETTTPSTQPPQDPLTASSAFIYNCSDSTYAFTKGDLDAKLYPASITKLFTAYVALKYLDPAQAVIAGDILDTVPSDSSRIWLTKGDVLTAEQLLYGTLMCSGGDAARVLAAEAGRAITGEPTLSDPDAMEAFVAEMNRQAASLGMINTHFVNPDGYHDANHYSCMADITTIGTLCLDTALIRQIAATPSIPDPLSDTAGLWKNTNLLLHTESEFYQKTAVGLKTGYTHNAGRCLLSAFLVDGNYVLAGVFGCQDPDTTYITQFQNTAYLYDTYIAQ